MFDSKDALVIPYRKDQIEIVNNKNKIKFPGKNNLEKEEWSSWNQCEFILHGWERKKRKNKIDLCKKDKLLLVRFAIDLRWCLSAGQMDEPDRNSRAHEVDQESKYEIWRLSLRTRFPLPSQERHSSISFLRQRSHDIVVEPFDPVQPRGRAQYMNDFHPFPFLAAREITRWKRNIEFYLCANILVSRRYERSTRWCSMRTREKRMATEEYDGPANATKEWVNSHHSAVILVDRRQV